MITPPTAPSPGKPVSASFFSRLIAWVKSCMLIDGVGYRLRRTPYGTSLILNPVELKAQGFVWLHPWKVFGTTKSDDVDHCFEIYIPGGTSIYIGGIGADISGISSIDDKPGYYTADAESDVSDDIASLRLFIYTTPDEESDEGSFKAVCTITAGEDETSFRERDDVLDIIMTTEIAWIHKESETVKESGTEKESETGIVDAQILTYNPYLPEPFYT